MQDNPQTTNDDVEIIDWTKAFALNGWMVKFNTFNDKGKNKWHIVAYPNNKKSKRRSSVGDTIYSTAHKLFLRICP